MPAKKPAPKGPTTMLLTRTGQLMPFLEVAMGQPFYSEGIFWTRTAQYAATDLRKLNFDIDHPNECYGSCAFGREGAPMMVEKVAVSFQ